MTESLRPKASSKPSLTTSKISWIFSTSRLTRIKHLKSSWTRFAKRNYTCCPRKPTNSSRKKNLKGKSRKPDLRNWLMRNLKHFKHQLKRSPNSDLAKTRRSKMLFKLMCHSFRKKSKSSESFTKTMINSWRPKFKICRAMSWNELRRKRRREKILSQVFSTIWKIWSTAKTE